MSEAGPTDRGGPASEAVRRRPRRGDVLEVRVEALDDRGDGLARHDGHRVRVPGALPGETARVEVRRRRRDAVDARALATLAPAPRAVEPRCPHASSCGGCTLQGLAYDAQLAELGRLLERTLAPLVPLCGGPLPVAPVVGCDDPWRYRNKMDFTFASRRWIEPWEERGVDAAFALGLHVRGVFSKVLDVRACPIAFAEAEALVATTRRLARELDLAPWDVREHRGLLRHLVVRKGFATGQVLVDLVTSEDATERVDAWARALLAAHPEVTTLVQNVNTRAASIAVGERERVLHGPGWIEERLAGLAFRVSANSFFQTNTRQAERLVALVRRAAATDGVVHDVCSGAGVLGLALAADAREVWGFELAPSAVADARANAERNGVANATFVEGDVARTLAEADAPPPDVVVADPPRAGLHDRALAAILRAAPRRVVYVSCNPRAAARDLAALVRGGWRLARVEPIDLFPHTPHLECVATLERTA